MCCDPTHFPSGIVLRPYSTARIPLPPEMLATTSRLFDNFEQHPTLHCSIVHFNPFLDFTFRYEAGFLISVRPRGFQAGSKFWGIFAVTPQGGKPEFFAGQAIQKMFEQVKQSPKATVSSMKKLPDIP